MSVDPYPGLEQAQLWDATLQALADLPPTSANTAPYFTGIDQAALMTVSPFARSFLDDNDAGAMKATLDFGSGVANRVALWADTDTLTSDAELYYDPTTNRLGIGNAAPAYQLDVELDIRAKRYLYVGGQMAIGATSAYVPLTFDNLLEPKIYFYRSGNARRGIATATTELRLFTDTALTFGHISMGDGSSFFEDMRLHSNGYLGIGTPTPTAPLSFANTVGHKIYIYDVLSAGPNYDRYGMALSGGTLEIFAPTTAKVAIGDMSRTNGTTFTPRLTVSDVAVEIPNVPVGMSTPAVAGWGLRVGAYPSYFGGALTVSGTATIGGTVTHSGQTLFSGLCAIYYGIDAGYWLRCPNAYFDSLYVGGQVNADSHYARTNSGFGYAPVSGYSIRAGNSHFDAAGFGYAGGSGYYIRAGSTYVDSFVSAGNTQLGQYTAVYGAPDGRWNFVNWGTSYFANTVQIAHYLGCYPYAPVTGYGIRCGEAYIDHLGVGTPPYAGWNIAANNILAWSSIQTNGSLIALGEINASGSIRCGQNNAGIKYAGVGDQWDAGYSNWIGFGWNGNVCVRVDAYQAGAIQMQASDRRLKLAIRDDVPGLDAICALKPISFEYDQSMRPIGFPKGRHYGLIAQDVQAYLPYVIDTDGGPQGWLMIDYGKIVPSLIVALTQLTARVKALETQCVQGEAQLAQRKAA